MTKCWRAQDLRASDDTCTSQHRHQQPQHGGQRLRDRNVGSSTNFHSLSFVVSLGLSRSSLSRRFASEDRLPLASQSTATVAVPANSPRAVYCPTWVIVRTFAMISYQKKKIRLVDRHRPVYTHRLKVNQTEVITCTYVYILCKKQSQSNSPLPTCER